MDSLRKLGLLAVVALATAACGDGTGPTNDLSRVEILMNGARYEAQTIGVDESIQLTGRVLDPDGNAIAGEPVEWSTDAAGVASVTSSGIVTGVANGNARIVARNRIGSDTALVTVSGPVTGELSCESATDVDLSVGETVELKNFDATRSCLTGSGTGAEYLLSLVNVSESSSARLNVDVEAAGVISGDGPSFNLLEREGPLGARSDDQFHMWLRDEVSHRLESRLGIGTSPSSFATAESAAIGELLSFNVESTSGDGCAQDAIKRRSARVVAEGQYAVIAADTLNPAGGFNAADYQAYADFFDKEVWPLVTGTFGMPSDIDQNGKIVILFTSGVNERPENSPASSTIFVGGFFFNRDLFPTSGTSACTGSNEREMFYLLVPDPNGEVSGRRFRTDFVRKTTRAVLVHEFQHLVNDSRRLHINRAPSWEETWLNEGLSHIAEELMFYSQSGLSAGQNIGAGNLASAEVRDDFDAFQLNNIDRLAYFLREPSSNSLMGVDKLATRGAAWYFLRYAADRTGSESALWRSLVTDAKASGLSNLRNALGTDPKEWIRDWAGAVALDDLVQRDSKYQVTSWNLRSLYPALTAYWPSSYYEIYPLNIQTLEEGPTRTSYTVSGAGAGYARALLAAGDRAALRVTVADRAAPVRLKVLVTRIR